MSSRHLPNYYSTPNTTLYSNNTKDWLHSNDYSMNHHTDMMDTEEALKNFQDYSITPTPSLTSNKARLTFLISENHRLKFEEENQKNFYYESRKNLQDCWNKLVNLRSHLQRFQEEIEEVKIEIIAHEAERSIWTGDIDEIFEQSEYRNGGNSSGHDWTLKSATRVAGLRNLRDKVKLKESIQSKILIFQEELSHKKQLLTKLSVQLQQSTTKVSSDLFTSSETSFLGLMSIDESMGIRAQLLTISDQIDDLELKIRQYKQSLGQLEREVNEHVDEVVWQEIENDQSFSKLNSHKKNHSRTPNRSFTSGNGNQSMSKNPIALAVSLSENEYLELVSHGPPLSTDLINALLKRNSDPSDDKAGEDSLFSTSLSASALLLLQQSSDHATIPEFTLDEILAGQAKVYRMNGELPQTYLTRLEKRILALQLVEIEVVKEFQELLNTVKRRREMLKDVENKRLKVELLLSNEDKTKVAISTNIRSEVLQTPSISTATGEKSFGQIPATPATMATPGLLSQSTLKVTNHHPEYYMSAEEVKETHDRIPAHSTTTPYRTSSIVTSPEKPIPAQEHHIITTSHSNSGGFNTPSATPHHPPSSSVTSGSVFTFNTDRVQTPESISTIHKYSSVPHRSFEKERAPSPPTPLTTGATTPVTATNNAGGNNNAVDMNNELAQNLRSMIRKKLSASMFEGSDQPQNSPVGKKPHKALIEEETEILALISLYLTTATSSSLPSTPSGKSKASGFHPTSTLLAQLNKSPRQQREKEKADLENEHPNDSPTIDPKLMKSLKMQVLSRLLQENFPDLTPQLEKINRSSKDKEAHDFSDNEDDADGVVFQSAYVSPRDTAMSKKINTDPIKIQTGNKRKSKKSVIPQDPVPDAKNPPPLSSNANNNLTKPSEEQKIKEKSGKVESAAKNSTKAATPVSANVHTMTSPSPHKTPNFQSPESGSATKRYQSCPICASLPKRPPLDFSEFREERRRNKALAFQATSHAATPETQGKESFHRHENNGDIIYVSSKHDAAYTSPKDIKTSSNNKARTALSSPPLSTAEPAPVALQVVTAPKPPPSSSVGTSPINRSTSFGMIKKDASTSPFPQRETSRITEIDPNHKELEEKLREEYFQKITQETERQLKDWKTKFFENPENENATDDEENENEDETADYESSNTNSSRLVNSRTQTPTIGRTTPKSAQTASIPIRKSKSVDAIPRPSEVKTEVKTSPHISQPSTSLSIDSLPVKRENIVNRTNSSPNLHSSPTSKKNQARSPILTAAKASSSPPRNDLQASRRRDINRDAIRDVTAKLCQLAVDLEKSALENDENLEEEIQTISTAALPQNGLQRMSRDNTSMNAVLAELLQLVKLQQEELHHLRNVQETFFRTNASLTTSLQSSLNASDGAKGFARSSLLSSQESIQTIHPSVIDSRQPRFSEGSRNELEHEEEKLEEQSKSEEELEEEEVEEKKVHERSGAHEPGKMKKVGGTEENEVQALLSWINMIENQNHAHNAPEYNHQDQILAKHNPRYKVTSEEVQQLITLLEEKYRSIQQELTQPHQRKHHSSPQKKLSSSSPITASSTLEVEVILARHLPAMKHMSRSSDAYVELILLTFHPTIPVLSSKLNDDFKNHGEYEEAEEGRGEEEQKGNESSNRWKQNIPEVLAHFTDVDYNILNGNCVIRADMEFTVMEEVYGCIPVVIGYQRTSVQSETLYPNWRESFKFSLEEKELIAKEGKSMNNPFVEGSVLPSLNLQQRQQSVTVLWCLVRDSTRNGHQLRYKDEIIAQSAYQVDSEQFVFPSSTGHHPSSNLLPATSIKASAANSAASSYFHVTLSLYPPHSMKWRKGRVAIDPRAELKLGLQCFLSLERQYTLLQKEILSLLSALEELPALTSEEFEELGDIIPKAKNQKIKQIPELYWMDSPICFRIYRVFKHFKPQSSTETSHLRRSHESIPDNAPAIKRKKLNTHEEIAPVGRSHSISPQRTNHFKEELRHNEPSVPARKSNIFSSQPRSRSAEQSSAYVSEPAMPHPAMARPSPMKIIGLVERNKSPPFVLRSYDPPPKKPVSSRSWNSSKSAVPPNFLNTSLQNSYDDRPLQSVHHPDVIEAIDEPAPSPRKRGSVSPQKVVSRPKPKPQLKEESMDLSKLNRSVDLSIFKKSGNNYSSQVAVKAFANPHANQAKIKKKENGWR